jgi:hypothetical protein
MVVRPICNGLANRMPTQGVMDAVIAKMQVKAPGTADWRITLPIEHLLTLTIHLLPAVDTDVNRAAISTDLNTLIFTKDNSTAEKSQLLWAEVDAVVGVITSQYVLDETLPLAWGASEVPVLQQPINWI